MRVEPLHQLFAHGSIIETSLRKVKDNKERETSIQCPVMVGVVTKGLWSVDRFLERVSARSSVAGRDTHRRFPPAVHNKLNIIYGMLDQYLRGLFVTPSEMVLACRSQHERVHEQSGILFPLIVFEVLERGKNNGCLCYKLDANLDLISWPSYIPRTSRRSEDGKVSVLAVYMSCDSGYFSLNNLKAFESTFAI